MASSLDMLRAFLCNNVNFGGAVVVWGAEVACGSAAGCFALNWSRELVSGVEVWRVSVVGCAGLGCLRRRHMGMSPSVDEYVRRPPPVDSRGVLWTGCRTSVAVVPKF